MAALVARRRLERGVRLNYPETIALISDFVLEGARDGQTVADLMHRGPFRTWTAARNPSCPLSRDPDGLRIPPSCHGSARTWDALAHALPDQPLRLCGHVRSHGGRPDAACRHRAICRDRKGFHDSW